MILTAKWILPITSEPIEDGAVRVLDGKIVALGKKVALTQSYLEEERLDFGQAVILPGFVDAHTHLEFSIFRGICDDLPFSHWKLQLTKKSNSLSWNDWKISAELGVLEAIQSGITCIADITATGASLEAAKKGGLRGIIFVEVSEMNHLKVGEVLSEAKEKVAQWRDKTKNTNLKIGISPYSVYNACPQLFQKVSEYACKEKLLLGLHLAGSKDEYNFVKYGSGPLANEYRELKGWQNLLWQPLGVSPVKYLENWDVFEAEVLAVHCIQVNDYDIDVLKRYGVSIAHCPKCSAKLGMGVAPLSKFLKRGLNIGIGTDSPASNNTMDFFDEMRVGLLLQRGIAQDVNELSAKKFVELATLGGAKALRLEREIGSLEEGKKADLIAVDLSHSHQVPAMEPYSALVYTANQENILLTMVGGKILYLNGEYKTIDAKEVLELSEPIRRKLR